MIMIFISTSAETTSSASLNIARAYIYRFHFVKNVCMHLTAKVPVRHMPAKIAFFESSLLALAHEDEEVLFWDLMVKTTALFRSPVPVGLEDSTVSALSLLLP